MPLSPNQAFLLVISGCVALYYELIRPGIYLSAFLGWAAVLAGSYELSRYRVTPWGLSLIAAAILLFGLEMYQQTHFVTRLAATSSLAFGFCALIPGRTAISPALALPVCLLFGLVTGFLAGVVRRGRFSKRNFSPGEA